jgi:ATP-dependent DNA ligase
MAVFFDALYIDGKPLVEETYYDRTRLLYRLITTKPGRAIFSERFSLSLTDLDAASSDLANRYSEAIRDRKEGFVLKPADSTYVGYPNWVKLKKDYIEGFGDNLDFVLVGGGYSPERGRTSTKLMSGRKCNEWHVACWQNKEEVWRNVKTPSFTRCEEYLMIECATVVHGHVYSLTQNYEQKTRF